MRGEENNETAAHTHYTYTGSVSLRRCDQCEAVCPPALCRDTAFLPLGVWKKKTNTTFDHEDLLLAWELLEIGADAKHSITLSLV